MNARVWFVIVVGASAPAFAHGFAGSGWQHPLTGLDHMLAMLAIGAWSAQLGGRALYLVPAAFVGAMALGTLAGFHHLAVPRVELAIALSVVALGAAIATEARMAWQATSLATVLFGLAHGHAHGNELGGAIDPAGTAAGFLMTTAGLHVAGAAGGLLVLDHVKARVGLRLAGAVTALTGLWLALG